ncbi:cell division protein ZipA [Vibrio sp.]|uniref:cell division protein ZipA n=1 Tax=Vibrio sp. TaxID=678 RepID=UPI003D0FB5D6
MQELRFVLIIVGALAIAALLFHGLWTSKKEAKTKFGNKPYQPLPDSDEPLEADMAGESRGFAPDDDYEIIRVDKSKAKFASEEPIRDPLIDDYSPDAFSSEDNGSFSEVDVDDALPSITISDELELDEPGIKSKPEPMSAELVKPSAQDAEAAVKTEPEPEVIVLNVHCANNDPFVGTKLFDSMQQNGLLYGEMDIFHRHADMAGTGKVLFSVANMMNPGTLKHTDPAQFTTKGISFFMMLPCFGDGDQNFKLMLKTAQQIADDLGGNVLDDKRNLLTPDRISAYRKQIQDFKLAQSV